jgi:hypothetical protein
MNSIMPLVLALTLGQTPSNQAAVINAGKNSVVRDLDRTLPAVRFETWLQGLVGSGAALQWRVTDCGEQDGRPNSGVRDVPICAEVDVQLPGSRMLSLSLLAGSTERGLTTGPLTLFSGGIVQPDNTPIIWIKTLAELPKLLLSGLIPN